MEEQEKMQKLRERATKRRKRNRWFIAIGFYLCLVLIWWGLVICPKRKMTRAVQLMDAGDYETAFWLLNELVESDDVKDRKMYCIESLINSGKYEDAFNDLVQFGISEDIRKRQYVCIDSLHNMGDYETAYRYLELINDDAGIRERKKDRAETLFGEGRYEEAYALMVESCDLDQIKNKFYIRAKLYAESGEYKEAIRLLKYLNDDESRLLLEKCYISIAGEERYSWIQNITEGDVITFGAYEQDNDLSNDKEDIEWIVVEVDQNKTSMLLTSRYVLDSQPFGGGDDIGSWENCHLRKWMNEDFYRKAFDEKQQDMLLKVDDDWEDKVYLMNYICKFRYYGDAEGKWECEMTPYTVAQGGYTKSSDYVQELSDGRLSIRHGVMWIKPTDDKIFEIVGIVNDDGRVEAQEYIGVRPAIRMDLVSYAMQ